VREVRTLLRRLAVATLLICTAGCASAAQLNPNLEKVARAVPVPSGVTFVNVTREQMSTGLGTTYEVDVRYANAAMSCDELRAAWLAVLSKAHRQTYDVNTVQIFIKAGDDTVNVDLGDVLEDDCRAPSVGAQSEPQLS
jgi:hypothetical protein